MTQLNSLPAEDAKLRDSAFRIAAIFLGATALTIPVMLFLAWQTGAWQLYTMTGVLVVLGILHTAFVQMIRRGRSETGAWWFIATILGALLIGVFLIADLGITVAITAVVLTFVIANQSLPARSVRQALFAGIGVGLLSIVPDLLNLDYRLSVPVLNVYVPTITVGIIVLTGIIIARQTWKTSIATSLRLQITVWTGTIIAVVAAIIIGYSVITSRQVAIDSAQEEAGFIALAQAENVKIQIDPALDTARTMSHTLGSVKDPENPISLTREQANGILRKVAEENPSFLGTWTIWEPNAFDGLDAKYVNTPIHDETGRFIPYWVRSDANTVEGVAIVDYDTPGLNDWYSIPRETQQETVIPPYLYPINGVDVLMTTVSVPIVENGQFYGVTGVDYRVDFLQGIVDSIDLYNGTANAVLVTNDGTLVAVRNQPELTLQPASALLDDFAEIQPQLGSAETFVSVSPDGQFLRVFAPVQIVSGADWSFGLIIPFSEITATATTIAIREILISLAITILALLLLWYFTGQVVRPILDLTTVANAVSGGDLNAVAKVDASNEIDILARTFNSMTSQLRETLTSLEQRVADRTRNLELAAEVGRSVSQVRALDVMLKDAAELIRSQFDLYYVQVYLTDASQTNLLLLSGTGKVGAELLGRGHRLPLNTGSINGRAATEKKPVVIADTTASATFRPNPLLPDTRSEMAVPLLVGDKVVGVLDLQSQKANALSQELLPAFEALAGQVAIAIQNANLLAEAEQARAEVEAQARRLVRANWADYQDAIHKPEETGFVFEHNKISAMTQQDEANKENSLVAPISVTGETLGNLVVEMSEQSQGVRTAELVNTIAAQVAQQIESLRLLESAERYRAESEQASRRLTREGWKDYREANTGENLSYLYDLKEVRPYSNGDNHTEESNYSLPIKVRDETVGRLSVAGLTMDDRDSLELANAVAERLSAHIESLRQADQTQSALAQSEKLFDATRDLTQATGLQELVAAAVTTLNIPVVNRALLAIFNHASDDTLQSMNIVANWWSGTGYEATAVGTHYSSEALRALSMFTSPTPVFFDDMYNDERVDAASLAVVKRLNVRAMVGLPLFLGSRQIGTLILESEEVHNFSQEDIRLLTALAPQIATLLESRRQFERAQQQANRESTLNVISQKIQSATSVEAVLQIAARELGHALGAPMTVAQLSMKDKS